MKPLPVMGGRQAAGDGDTVSASVVLFVGSFTHRTAWLFGAGAGGEGGRSARWLRDCWLDFCSERPHEGRPDEGLSSEAERGAKVASPAEAYALSKLGLTGLATHLASLSQMEVRASSLR